VRTVSEEFGRLMNRHVTFTGVEARDALLSDASLAFARFGRPRVSSAQMIQWIAGWTMQGGQTLGKATRFEVRDGRF
jgi:hypothetical protein